MTWRRPSAAFRVIVISATPIDLAASQSIRGQRVSYELQVIGQPNLEPITIRSSVRPPQVAALAAPEEALRLGRTDGEHSGNQLGFPQGANMSDTTMDDLHEQM